MPVPFELDRVMQFLGPVLRGADPLSGDPALEARAAEHVTGNARLTPAEQVDIYRRQFWLRHVDSLAEDYTGLGYLLGEDALDAFFRAYLEAHPPHHYSLRDLGVDLVGFAAGYPFPEPLAQAAREMVRYEHAFIDLFDGAEPPPLDPQKLAAIPEDGWERARIVVHPLLVRMQVEYPVHLLRRLSRDPEPPPLTEPPAPAPANLVLYRDDDRIRYEELEPLAFALLTALARGEALVPACDGLAATLEPAAAEALGAQVGPWFQQWTARRWIVDVLLE